MWSSIAFAAFLLAISTSMLLRHRQAWRSAARQGLNDREHDYLYRQYRRRFQASALIGLIGLAVVGGIWVSRPRVMLLYWSGVSLMVVWMGCLALADLFSTRSYFKQVHQEHVVEHEALQAELERIRRRQSNGRGGPKQDDENL